MNLKTLILPAYLSVEAISEQSCYHCRGRVPPAKKDRRAATGLDLNTLFPALYDKGLSLHLTCIGPGGRNPVFRTACSSLPNCSFSDCILKILFWGGWRRKEGGKGMRNVIFLNS